MAETIINLMQRHSRDLPGGTFETTVHVHRLRHLLKLVGAGERVITAMTDSNPAVFKQAYEDYRALLEKEEAE